MIDLAKIEQYRREDEVLRRLGVERSGDGTIHQVDILEAVLKRLEALERKTP